MKKTLKFILAINSALILSAWTFKTEIILSKAEWLKGTWENKTPRGSIYETWKAENEKEFSGMSYMIKDSDSIVFENIKLIQEDSNIYYLPVVKNQNGGLPVKFKASVVSDTKLVFENPEHDFPQLISYTKINNDSLVAEISGTRNGTLRKQIFPMKRID